MLASTSGSFDLRQLRTSLRQTYARIVADPRTGRSAHYGIEYAVERLRYDRAELDSLPASATDRFAGIGNPMRIGPISPGETVLDVGCGSGVDLLLAARKVGSTGRVIGIDLTPEMLVEARHNAIKAGVAHRVDIRDGLAESLPVAGASVDAVMSNGLLNNAHDKTRTLAEMARVLKPGGRLLLADVFLERKLPTGRGNATTANLLTIDEVFELMASVGYEAVRVAERFAYVKDPLSPAIRLQSGIHGANVAAVSP